MKKRIVFECRDCGGATEYWGQRTPKRCEECAAAHRKSSQKQNWNERKEKAKAFDEIVSLLEAGGIDAIDDVFRVIEDVKAGGHV